MRALLIASMAASLLASSAAQGTFVVDVANGPGTAFTEIAAAATTVPGGSILLVRAGLYAPVLIDAKSLTVLCDANVSVSEPPAGGAGVIVRNTAAGQRVVVRGLGASFELSAANGLVLLDRVRGLNRWLHVSACPQVVVRDSSFTLLPWPAYVGRPAAAVAGGSRVGFETCQLAGALGQDLGATVLLPTAALDVGLDGSACHVQLASCNLQGGIGGWSGSPWLLTPHAGSPAVRLDGGSSVRVGGDASHSMTAGWTPPGALLAGSITGTGSARIDPAIQAQPAPASTATLTVTRPELSNLVASGGALGGSVLVERSGAAGLVFVIALSLPGTPLPWFGEPDPLWLDPATTVVEAFGVASGSAFQLQRPVPAVPVLQGFALFWQAVELPPAGGLPLSNPAVTVLH